MRLRKLLVTASVAIAATLPASNGKNAPNSEIIVYEAGQGWSLGGKLLTKGQRLSAISELTGTQAESALVLNCGKEQLVAYACPHEPCRVPVCSIKVDGVTVTQFSSHNLFEEISAVFRDATDSYLRREPKPLAILGVRAGGSLSDGVVRKAGPDIHWGPVFKRVLEGTYCLRMTSLPVQGTTTRNVSINWDRTVDAEGILPMPGLQPGLYAVEKGSPDASGQCVVDPDLPAVWVLVAANANFDQVERAWTDASAQFSQLQKAGATPFVIATFRHAVLSYLADSIGAKPSV
jgi:hypothetical protein